MVGSLGFGQYLSSIPCGRTLGVMNTTKIESLLAETDWLRRLARQLVADPNHADDVTQDVMVTALESGDQVRGPARPWLGRVARHRVVKLAERERRRRTVEQEADATGYEPSAQTPPSAILRTPEIVRARAP